MNTTLRKLAAYAITAVMVAVPLTALIPPAAALVAPPNGGSYVFDVDFSLADEDDYWSTDPIEWGARGANIEIRHVPCTAVDGISISCAAFDSDYDEGDLGLALCDPTGAPVETNGASKVDPETDADEADDEAVDIYDPAARHGDAAYGVRQGGIVIGATAMTDTTGDLDSLDPEGTEDPRWHFFDDSDDGVGAGEDPNDPDTLDDNDNGKIASGELNDAADDGDSETGTAFKTTFEDVDIDLMGMWSVYSGTDCDDTDDGNDELVTMFFVDSMTAIEVTTNPGTLTFGYDSDSDEPEPDDQEFTITAESGGDPLENAVVVVWACDRAIYPTEFCDSGINPDDADGAMGADRGDPDPADFIADVDITGGDGATDYSELLPGAGTYLIQAYCIVQDDSDEYITDPDDLDSDGIAECVDPADIGSLDNTLDVTALDAYDESGDVDAICEIAEDVDCGVAQLQGNTTLTIEPGDLDVTLVKGEEFVENRVQEAVWRINYAGSDALVLSDNTHEDDDDGNPYDGIANADGNFTLDITLPDGNHVLLAYDLAGVETADDANVDLDGIMQCTGTSNAALAAGGCDTVSGTTAGDVAGKWTLVADDAVTDCEVFLGDDYDCADDAGTDRALDGEDSDDDTEGDVDILTDSAETPLVADVDDLNSGLDAAVYEIGAQDDEDADYGVRMRLDPEIDQDDPDDTATFNEIDDPEENDDDMDFRLGYLSVFVPWASGTYEFELRVNHYTDQHPEFVGSWTLDVASAPEFGFEDVEPRQLDVPARVDTNDDPTTFDPVQDSGVDTAEDEDLDDIEVETDAPGFYTLAFTLTDADGDHVNAWPCNGDDNDGDTIEADEDDGEGADTPDDGIIGDEEESGDEIIFLPDDGEDRDCPDFDGADDVWVEGNFLYDIRDDWVQETYADPNDFTGNGVSQPGVDQCEDVVTALGEEDIGFDEEADSLDGTSGGFDDVDTEDFLGDGGGADEDPELYDDLIPLYCIYNVVPSSPGPITVHAMIDGQDITHQYMVDEGGVLRVVEVTAAAEADGSIRVSLTDADGSPVSGDFVLFERGFAPNDAAGEQVVSADDGDVLAASGSTGTFSIDEADEVGTNPLAVYGTWDAGDNTNDYAYARVNIEPASDLDTSVSPTEVTAGIPTDFTVNVTDGEDAYEVYFLTHYDYMRVQREGVTYVDSTDFRDDDADFDPAGDLFDFDFGGDESEPEEMELKAEGPYHVYVRDTDALHDNNGSMPTVDVTPPRVTFTPGNVAFALSDEAEVVVNAFDADGNELSGTLRVAYDVDNEFQTSDSYGFAGIEGSDVDQDSDIDDDEEWGGQDDEDAFDDFVDNDDFPYSYLEYCDDGSDCGPALGSDEADLIDALTEINLASPATVKVTGEDPGPVNWTFMDEEGDTWVNTTGGLNIVAPQITLQPDRLVAGQGADVTVTVRDLEGEPVENLFLALCGTPLSTATSCTGVVATGADGMAVVNVLPTGTGQIEVWVHEDITGEEEGDCQIEPEDMARINPLTGLALTGQEDEVDADCDADGTVTPAEAGEDFEFTNTNVVLEVVATQSLLRVTVPDQVAINAPTNIAVSRGGASGAQTPVSGATVTITGPTGTQVFSGTTNAAGQVSFTPNAAGQYTVRASSAGFQDGSATFTAGEGAGTPGVFAISDFVISPTTVRVGETVEARATIRNTGASSGTATVLLLVNGAQRVSQGVTLGPGESQAVAFDFTPSVAGTTTMKLKVGAAESNEQTLTVQPRSTTGGDGGGEGEPEPGVPGFEAIFALAALGAAVLAFRRKK